MLFKNNKNFPSSFEYLVVGLGNPGLEYEITRHNAGFLALDVMQSKLNFTMKKLKFKSLVGECTVGDKKVIVIKPQTFMNNSGEAVRECAAFYKIPVENIIVLYDDISLDVGKMRIRRKGSAGGHNGIKSIIYHLGSENFPRVKIGVGKKPHPDYDLPAWVLSNFTKDEQLVLEKLLPNAVEAAEMIIEGKTDRAMNLFNS